MISVNHAEAIDSLAAIREEDRKRNYITNEVVP